MQLILFQSHKHSLTHSLTHSHAHKHTIEIHILVVYKENVHFRFIIRFELHIIYVNDKKID